MARVTQSERKREHKRLKQEQEEQQRLAEQAEKDQQQQAALPTIPQEDFIKWIGGLLANNLTSGKIIELTVLAFAANQAYIKYGGMLQDEKDLNLLISCACGIVAIVAGFVISYRVQAKSATTPVVLPEWNYIYLIFLSGFMALVTDKRLMLFNIALTASANNLPVLMRMFIQMAIITSNSEHTDLVLNSKVIAVNSALFEALGAISKFQSLSKVEVNMFSILLTDLLVLVDSAEIYVVVLQKLMVSFLAGLVVLFGLFKVLPNSIGRTVLVLVIWPTVFVSSAIYQLTPFFDNENPLKWLANYIASDQTRVKILAVWLTSLLLLIPTIFSYKINLSSNFRRKIWHFIILVLIVYPLHLDPEFVKLSLAGAIILFLVVEMIRYLKLYPFGNYLDQNLRHFTDFRDEKGPVIISYIYLIVGISVPILMDNSIVGLVSLGVGDSLASIIGSNYGLIHWADSQKTVEGTFTFILSSFGVMSLLKYIGWYFQATSVHSLLLVCTISGILEGNSDLNDNLLVPGYMFVLLSCLQ